MSVEFIPTLVRGSPVDISLASSLTLIETVTVLPVERLSGDGGPKTELNPVNAPTVLFFNISTTYSKE